MKKAKVIDTRSIRAGQVVSSSVKSAGALIATGSVTFAKDAKDGAVHIAKGVGFFSRQVANVVADFGRGLKRGWEKS